MGHAVVSPNQNNSAVRYNAAGKRTTREHIGPQGSEEVARLDDLEAVQHQAKTLRAMGFAAVEHDAALVLAQLHNKGVFAGGGMLVGTRAFGSLLNQLGWRATPISRLRTPDTMVEIERCLAVFFGVAK